MRDFIHPRIQLGALDIGSIKRNLKSRDEIPQILQGLQHIYTSSALRERVFAILEEVLPQRVVEGENAKADPNNGRPGMAQWAILVLGILHLGFNADYDHIQELANQHTRSVKCLGTATGQTKHTMRFRRSGTTYACSPRRLWIGLIKSW